MDALKLIHVTTALLSISGFVVRGMWMLRQSPMLQQKWVRIAPHINDTVLLLSALSLIWVRQYPLSSDWLLAKIFALLLYILLGFIALRLGKSQIAKVLAFAAAIVTFSYIVLVAVTKTPFIFM